MKKLLALSLSLVLALGALAGCGGSDSSSSEQAAQSTASEASSVEQNVEETGGTGEILFRIGVSQFLQHDALDASYQGFVDRLAELGYVDGENITIDYNNASGDMSNTNTIATKLVNDGVDLILAIATPSAQAAANATKDIPILITAVTDAAATNLVQSNELPGTNVSGTSDLTACAEQMDLLVQLLPEAKTVGFLYTSSEENSILQIEVARAAAEALGLTCVDYTVADQGDVQQVVQSMMGKVDVIYSPTDNVIAEAMATVAAIATDYGVPCIVGEENMVNNGGLASWSMSYYTIGQQTAEMAVDILVNGADITTMPIQYDENLAFVFNAQTAAALNIEIPEELAALATNEAAQG